MQAEQVFKDEVYAFIDQMSVEELRHVAQLAMNLAWPPYMKVGDQPPRPLDKEFRLSLQGALLQAMSRYTPGQILNWPEAFGL